MAMTEAALMNLTNKVLQAMVEGKGEVPKKKKADLVAQLLAIQEQEQVSRPTDRKSAKKWFSVAHELDMESGYPEELMEALEHLKPEDFEEIVTTEFAKKLLLESGDEDIFNSRDHYEMASMIEKFPPPIIEELGTQILGRIDYDFLDEGEYLTWHHKGLECWYNVCQAMAPKTPEQVAQHAREVLLKRFQENCDEGCKQDAQVAAIMLNEIQNANPDCIAPISKQIFAAGNKFEGGWEGLAEGDVPFVENVREKINGVRDACSTKPSSTEPKRKRAKTSK